jgi:alpha-glucuronidase
MKKLVLSLLCCLIIAFAATAEDGYRLWLRYDLIENESQRNTYRKIIRQIVVDGDSPTVNAIRQELTTGLNGLLGSPGKFQSNVTSDGTVIFARFNSSLLASLKFDDAVTSSSEGYVVHTTTINKKKVIVVAGANDVSVLYGTFHFLRLLQTRTDLSAINITSIPKVKVRILNHWDNLDRTVERGYAGFSLWDWHRLPELIDPRYIDYARANASIGINATVLTNVNANALILTPMYLEKVKALADIFRPYGIRVYLTARFSAPIELGKLTTADPLDPHVAEWWKEKVKEIYKYVPDFGGFLVKANSEGQPGPQNYNKTHADGANVLADAVAPFNGIVMWRAFVYDNKVPDDRHKQAYNEFKPLDGSFKSNVLVQVKNGAIDFQPREPFHPLFGAMTKTPVMMEFQITQEYLGFATHLVYLGTLFKECLDADTYAKGKGSTVAKAIDGSVHPQTLSAMAGVANIGNDRNWTGHLFGQSNWYAFGRLAWDHNLTAESIADEWIRMTFNNKPEFLTAMMPMMMNSRNTTVSYMTPLGLHHIMGANHHYGPGPWISKMPRADWTSTYYHKADSLGVGFDRTAKGSDALSQYTPEVVKQIGDLNTCPEEYLLWFHHVPWNHKMRSGKTLWEEICVNYYNGAKEVGTMRETWKKLQPDVDPGRFKHVDMLLQRQETEALLWRNSCVLYFQTFSKQAIPLGLEKPGQTLDFYMKLEYPYAPGIRPRW